VEGLVKKTRRGGTKKGNDHSEKSARERSAAVLISETARKFKGGGIWAEASDLPSRWTKKAWTKIVNRGLEAGGSANRAGSVEA